MKNFGSEKRKIDMYFVIFWKLNLCILIRMHNMVKVFLKFKIFSKPSRLKRFLVLFVQIQNSSKILSKNMNINIKILHPVVRRHFDFYLFSGICQTSEDLYARMVFWMWLSALLRPHRSVHVLLFKFYPNFIQIS